MPPAASCERSARGRVSSMSHERDRAQRHLQELRLGGQSLRDRVPLLRGAAAQAGAEAGAARRRARGAAPAPAPARLLPRSRSAGPLALADRPYATLAVILGSAILLLVQKATGDPLVSFGGLVVPLRGRVVALPHRPLRLRRRRLPLRRRARPGDLRDRGRAAARHAPTAVLLLACGSLGMLAAERRRRRPRRHHRDRRRQRDGARRARRLVRAPPRRVARGDRRGATT